MKKLILIAVVVFGFAATSFAQHVSDPVIISMPKINKPLGISPDFAFGAQTAMSFGEITNIKNGGWIHLSTSDAITTSDAKITVVAGSKAATFLINFANIKPSITIPTIYFPFTGGKLDIDPVNDLALEEAVGGVATSYKVKIGGTVTLYDGATANAFNLTGLTISVNNQ